MGNSTPQWNWNRVKVDASSIEAAEPVSSESNGTYIGSGALFEGTLKLRGNFQIDSEFRGELRTEGKIVIGTSGSVVGDVWASEVEILGAVVGNVSARRLLTLRSGSRVHGKMTSVCIEMERHAFFNGTTVMTEPQRRTLEDSKQSVTDSKGPADDSKQPSAISDVAVNLNPAESLRA
jgi:cytoskeletal protein CcmA (bactofilin family)